MLAHLLAIVVGLGSVALYLAAFFFPEVHRKHDFFWSGVGCFYALILWVDANQLSATELLGHSAAIALVARFGWQTLALRRKRTPRDLQTPLTYQSWQTFGQEITALGLAWLRRTPLGRFLPQPAAKQSSPSSSPGSFRASSLKQVDYEFVDDLPPNQEVTFRKASGPPPVQASLVSPEPTIQPDQSPPPKQNSDFVVAPKPQKSGSAQQPNRKGTQKPSTLWQRGIVLKDWLLEVVTTAAKPKPKKPVIVIPPRSPQSETYPGAGDADPSLESAGTDRAKTHNSVAQAQIGENSQASSPSPSHPGDPQAEQSSAASTDAINGGEPAVSRSADVGADRGEDRPEAQNEIDNWSEFEADGVEARSEAWDEIDNWSEFEAEAIDAEAEVSADQPSANSLEPSDQSTGAQEPHESDP